VLLLQTLVSDVGRSVPTRLLNAAPLLTRELVAKAYPTRLCGNVNRPLRKKVGTGMIPVPRGGDKSSEFDGRIRMA
jgi:hypothetical protein